MPETIKKTQDRGKATTGIETWGYRGLKRAQRIVSLGDADSDRDGFGVGEGRGVGHAAPSRRSAPSGDRGVAKETDNEAHPGAFAIGTKAHTGRTRLAQILLSLRIIARAPDAVVRALKS